MAIETLDISGVEHLPGSLSTSSVIPRPYDWSVDEPRPFDQDSDIDATVGFFINDYMHEDARTIVLPEKDLHAQMDKAKTVDYINKKIRESFSTAGASAYIMGLLLVLNPQSSQQWGIGTGSMLMGAGIRSLGRRLASTRQQG